ncbi:hypothetical protein [Flavobacterium sp. TSSA_36]|uniref:hypothetical protein n=1 Tax=Flavobacterium sp. TSSA_36 TaxID=3447669 RepID=UPI003F400F45
MKNNTIVGLVLGILFMTSCQKEVESPKVIYDKTPKTASMPKRDSSKVAIADLPIQMEGTEYLIHPIGDLRIYEKGLKSKYGSSAVNDASFTISNVAQNEITGFLQNLKFQKIDSDSIHALSNEPILIETATYLKPVADRIQKQIMVYTMVDADTNKDGKLDTNDINTLYLSLSNGKKFTKISTDLEELIDWNVIESTSRLYFRTIEDTNKNGQFDEKDVVHYNYIDLSKKHWEVIRYAPI